MKNLAVFKTPDSECAGSLKFKRGSNLENHGAFKDDEHEKGKDGVVPVFVQAP